MQFGEQTVEAITNAEPIAHRFDVNIGRPHLDGGMQDQIDQLNDWRVGKVEPRTLSKAVEHPTAEVVERVIETFRFQFSTRALDERR